MSDASRTSVSVFPHRSSYACGFAVGTGATDCADTLVATRPASRVGSAGDSTSQGALAVRAAYLFRRAGHDAQSSKPTSALVSADRTAFTATRCT